LLLAPILKASLYLGKFCSTKSNSYKGRGKGIKTEQASDRKMKIHSIKTGSTYVYDSGMTITRIILAVPGIIYIASQ
jgi:hypothetical protein